MHKKMIAKSRINNLRNFIFGVEDSVVSTIGLVSGIAFAGVPRATLILTGVVLIFVEAFSMAVGSLLSENSVEEMEAKLEVPFKKALAGSLVMLFSYLLSGILIMLPYIIWDVRQAFYGSIIVAMLMLLALGIFSGQVARINRLKRASVMILIGGLTIFIGIAAGILVEKI